MAIAHRATGAATFGANSITPAIPAAQVTGDMMLCLVAGKPYNGGLSVSGWTQLGSYTDGTTAAGTDTGSMLVTAWYKEATSDTETNPTVTEGSPTWNVFGALVMVFSKASDESWITPVDRGGGDATAGTGFSVTAASDPGVATKDFVVSFAGFRSDAATPCSTHLVATQTGVTYTNTHDPSTDPETTTGGDMGMCVNRASVSGVGTAAPVIAATLAASHTGSAMLIRLRVGHAAGDLAQAQGFSLVGKKGGAAALGALAQAQGFALVGRKGGIRALGDQSLAIGLTIASGKSVAKALGDISLAAALNALVSHKGGVVVLTLPQAASLTAVGRKGGQVVLGVITQGQAFSLVGSGGHAAALGAIAQPSSMAALGRKGGVTALGTITSPVVLSITGQKGHAVALGTITASASLTAAIRKGGLVTLADLAQAYTMTAAGAPGAGAGGGPAGDIALVASLSLTGRKGGLVAITLPVSAALAATGRKGAASSLSLVQVAVLAIGAHKGAQQAAGDLAQPVALVALGRKGGLVALTLPQAYAMALTGTGVRLVGIIRGTLASPAHGATVGGGYASAVGGSGHAGEPGGVYDAGINQAEYDATVED